MTTQISVQGAPPSYETLLRHLRAYERLAVAFSGGVDSTLLARAAFDALGENALAITIHSAFFSRRERDTAAEYAQAIGIRRVISEIDILAVQDLSRNRKNRCYTCKTAIAGELFRVASVNDIAYVAEGSNTDDLADYRPGMQAVKENGLCSPFLDLGFSKSDIRKLSKALDLPSWDKPAMACLASRIPYGSAITQQKLDVVGAAERYLSSLGFVPLRVRHHDAIARIEISPEQMPKLVACKKQVYAYLKELGFLYVTLDIGGFKSGGLNVDV